jgi:hypothetical protein
MENTVLNVTVEDFLFGKGQNLDNYFIDQTPISEMLCYRNSEGREFDLPIWDDELAAAVMKRLKGMGVRIIKLG